MFLHGSKTIIAVIAIAAVVLGFIGFNSLQGNNVFRIPAAVSLSKGAGTPSGPPSAPSPLAAAAGPAPAARPAATPAAVPAAPTVGKYAVIIGIDYDHYDFGAVHYADQDAGSMYRMLTQQKGFLPQNIRLLQNNQATHDNIMSALSWLVTNPGINANSEVVFFYSGHGLRNGAGAGLNIPGFPAASALVPFDFYNYDYHKGDGLIWDGDLADKLSLIHPHLMWVSIDSCFAGGFIRPGIAGPNRIVTTSSQADELSNELPSAQRGVFTNFLVDQGIDRGLPIEQAFWGAFQQSQAYHQDPQISDNYPQSGDL
jgi:hypothetical protein